MKSCTCTSETPLCANWVDAVLAGVNGKEHDGRVVKAEVARKQRGDESPATPTPAPAGDVTVTPDKP